MPAGDGVPLVRGPLKPAAGGFGIRGTAKALLEELSVAALGLGQAGFRRPFHPEESPTRVGLHSAAPEIPVGEMPLGAGLSGFGIGQEPLDLLPVIQARHFGRALRIRKPGTGPIC